MDSNENNNEQISEMPALEVSTELLNYDVVADVLALPAPVETPLAAEDEEALEAGIASMFETLLLSDAVYEAPAEDETTAEDEIEPTFALLDELNRIWAQPLAA